LKDQHALIKGNYMQNNLLFLSTYRATSTRNSDLNFGLVFCSFCHLSWSCW